MGIHRILHQAEGLERGTELSIGGEEAHHAVRVKRIEPGDQIELLDGAGGRATAALVRTEKDRKSGWRLVLRVSECRREPRPAGGVELWTAVPKGGRLEDMVDQLSQVGVAAWAPLRTARGVAEANEHKRERLQRVVLESAKQCGRSWAMELKSEGSIKDAFEGAAQVIVADGSGEACGLATTSDVPVRILIGPEGGWTPEELALARQLGARVWAFGPHVMRVETAAVAAAAAVISRSPMRTSHQG